MKRLVVDVDAIMNFVIVNLAGVLIVVIMRVMMDQIVRHKFTAAAHLARYDQLSIVETV